MGIILNADGKRIVRRGGDKSLENLPAMEADDRMLFLELVDRAPNMSPEDYCQAMIALRMEYGMDALKAVQSGHVQFELVAPRDMPEGNEGE